MVNWLWRSVWKSSSYTDLVVLTMPPTYLMVRGCLQRNREHYGVLLWGGRNWLHEYGEETSWFKPLKSCVCYNNQVGEDVHKQLLHYEGIPFKCDQCHTYSYLGTHYLFIKMKQVCSKGGPKQGTTPRFKWQSALSLANTKEQSLYKNHLSRSQGSTPSQPYSSRGPTLYTYNFGSLVLTFPSISIVNCSFMKSPSSSPTSSIDILISLMDLFLPSTSPIFSMSPLLVADSFPFLRNFPSQCLHAE